MNKFAIYLLPFAMLLAVPARASVISTYTVTEVFGVSHPNQIIDFDVVPPNTNVHLADKNGNEVPSQVLTSTSGVAGAQIAVETSLAAGTSQTWQLMTGAPSVPPANPVTGYQAPITLPSGIQVYQITNGKTGVRIYNANGQMRTIPIQSITVAGNTATVVTSNPHYLETGRSNDTQIGGWLATTNLNVTLSGLVKCNYLNGQSFPYSEPGQESPSRTQIIINNIPNAQNCTDTTATAPSALLTVPEERMAPTQGILLQDGVTWTANPIDSTAGGNLIWNFSNYALNLGQGQTQILESGPLKVTIQVTYNFNSLGIYYGGFIEPPGLAHFTETITLEADQPSILVEDDMNYDLQYFLNFNNEVNPDQARFRPHTISNIEFGHNSDGSAFTCPTPNGNTCDAFREFPVPTLPGYVTQDNGTTQTLQIMNQWNPWAQDSGWYWMLYNKEAADGPVVGMFPDRTSTAIGDNNTGVGVFTLPVDAFMGSFNPQGIPLFGFNFQSQRRSADNSVFPLSHYSWGIFVGTKSGDLRPPDDVQNIGLQMNLHGGINLNKVYRYDVNFNEASSQFTSLYLQNAVLTSLIQQVRNDPGGNNGSGIAGFLWQTDPADRPLFSMWEDTSENATTTEANSIAGTAQTMLNDYVNGNGIYGQYMYWGGASTMQGEGIYINSILADPNAPSPAQTAIKADAVAYANIVWDNDFVPMNFSANGLNAGTANMPVQEESYRDFFALFLPNLPGISEATQQIVQDVINSLSGLINPSGAEISSTHYQEASISTTLDALMQIQQLASFGLADPFATQPLLAAYANFNLQQMTTPEVRYGGIRKTVSIGDGSTESQAIPGKLATAFSASNPTLSQQTMWAWQQTGKCFSDQPGTGDAVMINEQLPAQDPQLGNGNFSGYFSVLRDGWGTPDESASWIVNGNWYQDHREDDAGEVALYALEAPLSVHWGSLYSPNVGGGNMHNTVIPTSNYGGSPWNADNQPTDAIFSGWISSTNRLFASFTYSSVADAQMTSQGGATWTRRLYSLHHQSQLPIIMIWDSVSGIPGGVVRSLNLMADPNKPVLTPAGPITPIYRLDTDPAEVVDTCVSPDACPSVSQTNNLPVGLNHFSFTGQTWNAHPTKGVDWDFYEVTASAEQFVLGNWGHSWNPTNEAGQFQQANGIAFEENQDILRVAGSGPFTAIILPNFKGQLPSDRSVIQQGSGVLITQNGATWYVDPTTSYYKSPTLRVLTSYTTSFVQGDDLGVQGGPTEIQAPPIAQEPSAITVTAHGPAGNRILTLPGGWTPGGPFTSLGNGLWQLAYAGGNPLTIVLQPGSIGAPIFVNPLAAVKVYPNPWRSDKDMSFDMTFSGLTVGTTIKIFTVSGHEVKELNTNNPSILWDLTNNSGEKVASGIYIYLVTDGQGDKARGKLAIIK